MSRMVVVVVAAVLAMVSMASHAQLDASAYPNKPVRIVVGFTPGSATDVTARLFAQRLGEMWGVGVTVENTPGRAVPSEPLGPPRVRPTAIR